MLPNQSTHLGEDFLSLPVGCFRFQFPLVFRLVNRCFLAGERFQDFQIMKRMHLLNQRLLLQGFRPRFPPRSIVVVVAIVVAIVIAIIAPLVPVSSVLGETNRIVSVIIVITSTSSGGRTGAGMLLLRW